MTKQTATFGGGCFWCIEAIIQRLAGVESVVSGYTGGKGANPSYREICGGRTGHAEVVQVTFDSTIISYKELITVFMTSHDPTTKDRQGADRGTQYRSAIFYHNLEQKQIAEAVIKEVQTAFSAPIVTQLDELTAFYRAESYHQNYYKNNGRASYCRVVIDPKVNKLRQRYAHLIKKEEA